jgi:hypothetical protein
MKPGRIFGLRADLAESIGHREVKVDLVVAETHLLPGGSG